MSSSSGFRCEADIFAHVYDYNAPKPYSVRNLLELFRMLLSWCVI